MNAALKLSRGLNIMFFLCISKVLFEKPVTLFTFHPIIMVLFWAIFCEGVVSKKRSIKRHQNLMLFAAIVGVFGVSIMYQVKENNKKDHYQTYHGLIGASVSFVVLVQAIAAYYMPKSSKKPWYWKLHGFNGFLMFAGVFVSVWLHIGTEGGWLQTNAGGNIVAISAITFAMSGMMLLLAAS
jgi:hypothetical protein